MLKLNLLLSGLATLVLALGVAGCGDAKKAAPKSDDAKQGSAAKDDPHAGHDHADGKFAEEFAKLSAEDRAAAEKQKVCPVSDEPLGSMGVPLKVEVKGRTVFLCCEGCEESLKNDPDKYLAKLDKN